MTLREAKAKIVEILDKVDGIPSTPSEPIAQPTAETPQPSTESVDYTVGDCIVPVNLGDIPMLTFSTNRFRAPSTIDNRDYCLKPLNQGRNPWCAAYTAKMFCEVVKWMERDYPDQDVISAETVYRYAKTIDGSPAAEGTSLTAVLQCLLDKGIFDKSKCRIQVVRRGASAREAVKYAVHKFGTLPAAFNCTTEWFTLNRNKTCITDKGSFRVCGGHAVLIDYYDRNGVGFCNSWGEGFGAYGHGMMTWSAFDTQFLYAACLTNVFDGLKLNI